MQEKAVKIDVSLLEKVFRTIVSIGILVAAFLLAMDIVNAETLDDYYKKYIDDEWKQTIYNTNNQTVIDKYESGKNLGYFCMMYGLSYDMLIYTDTDNIAFQCSTPYQSKVTFISNKSYLGKYGGWYGNQKVRVIYIKRDKRNLSYQGFNEVEYTFNSNGGTGYTNTSNNTVISSNGNFSSMDISSTQANNRFVGNGNFHANGYVYSVLWQQNSIFVEIPATTSGFECYKLDTKGGIYFIADYSSLITFDHSTSNTSTFRCDIHLDDTVQTITLNSSSEYYIYDVDHREAEYSFPITAFIPNYTNYEHVWIDNVQVVNTYSGHGGSVNSTFLYVEPIDIIGTFPEEELEPTIIPQISPVPTNLEEFGVDYYSGEELKTLYDNNMFNQWITESEFYNDIAQLGGGRSVKLVGATDQNVTENNTDNTLAYLSNVAAILSGTADVPGTGAVMTVVYGVNAFFDTISAPRNNGQIDFNGAAEDYIRDNLYSSTYDIIVLQAYYDAEALQTNTNNLLYTPIPSIDDLHAGEPYAGKIFYVILTQRYIESLNLDGLGSIQKLLESDVHYVKGIYDYMYDRLNDFEDKSLDGLKDILGVDNKIFDKIGNIDTYIQRIEGLLKKVLDAILSLNIQPTDTTAIENKLDDIYTRLGNSNLNSDWYKRYREWLYDETNDNVLNTPHEYMLNTFDDVKSLFDVFAYFDLPQTGFWSSAREYLNRMNGNTYNDNINDYLVTGIKSDNFYKDNCNTLVWSDIE